MQRVDNCCFPACTGFYLWGQGRAGGTGLELSWVPMNFGLGKGGLVLSVEYHLSQVMSALRNAPMTGVPGAGLRNLI